MELILSIIIDYLWESVVLLISGCSSLAIMGGLIYSMSFILINQFNNSESKSKLSENTAGEADDDIGISCVTLQQYQTTSKDINSPLIQQCTKCSTSNGYRFLYDGICKSCCSLSYEPGITNLDKLKEEILGNTVATDNIISDFNKSSHSQTNGYHRDGEVRQFMERLIETLIGGNLEGESPIAISGSTQYNSIYVKYHNNLSEVLSKLSASLHSTIDNRSLDESEKPSAVYVQLKLLIKEIFEEIKNSGSCTDYIIDNESTGNSVIEDQMKDRSYENILSTVIISKIISKNKEQSLVDTENLKGIDEQIEAITDQPDSSITSSIVETQMSLTVEEHVEEITTRYASSEEEESSGRVSGLAKFLSSLNFLKGRRAEFPELGKDIVDGVETFEYDADNDDYDYYGEDEEQEPLEDDYNEEGDCYPHRECNSDKEYADNGYGLELISTVDSWEDNWLFQRKKIIATGKKCEKGGISRTLVHPTIPVPMLVPNPSKDYRALIGDVDADEISDLSECSDSVLEELFHPTTMEDSNTTLTNGSDKEQKIPWYKLSLSSLTTKSVDLSTTATTPTDQDSSGVMSISRDVSEMYSASNAGSSPSDDGSSLSWTAVNDDIKNGIVSPVHQDDSGEGSLEGGQQDNEYAIHIESSSHAQPSDSDSQSKDDKFRLQKHSYSSTEPLANYNSDGTSSPTEDNSDTVIFKPGSIAEREHLKWQQAVPIPNNPYSKESIEKRSIDRLLSRSYSGNDRQYMSLLQTETTSPIMKIDCGASLPDYQKYGRDYYINGKQTDTQLESESSNGQLSTQQNATLREKQHHSSLSLKDQNRKSGKLVHVSSWADRKTWDKYNYNMPSVKELAKHFDETNQRREDTSPVQRSKQIHSLTARSMSREFREGLRNSCGRTFNRNVKTLSESSMIEKPTDEEQEHSSEDSGNGSPTDSQSSIRKLNEHVKFWKSAENKDNSNHKSVDNGQLQIT